MALFLIRNSKVCLHDPGLHCSSGHLAPLFCALCLSLGARSAWTASWSKQTTAASSAGFQCHLHQQCDAVLLTQLIFAEAEWLEHPCCLQNPVPCAPLLHCPPSSPQGSDGAPVPVSVWTSTLQRTILTAAALPFAKMKWKVCSARRRLSSWCSITGSHCPALIDSS